MPRLDPLTAMELAQEMTPGVPWILVSPTAGEEIISECFRQGSSGFCQQEDVPADRPRSPAGSRNERFRQSSGRYPRLQTPEAEPVPLLSSALESISDLIAIVDLEGRRLYNSPSYRLLLEDPEELRGTDSFMDIHPEDREKVRRAFHEVVRTGNGKHLEYRLMGIDGEVLLH